MIHPSPRPDSQASRGNDTEQVDRSLTAHSGQSLDWNAAERLLAVVQELSLVRDMASLVDVVRRAARALTGADGATFVLRDEGQCYYVDEDAIEPLWKGRRFPLETCVSGWAMLHRQPAIIPDIYQDARIPLDAYRPTFVHSLVMVPIRPADPIGAIGNYWATRRQPTEAEVRILRALADSTSIAIENVQLYESLERRVRERTALLEEANRELESFSHSVAHEFKNPLNQIIGFAQIARDHRELPPTLRRPTDYIGQAARRLDRLVGDLLASAMASATPPVVTDVDLSHLAHSCWSQLPRDGANPVALVVRDGLTTRGDRSLLRVMLMNLLGNAWKYSQKVEDARVEVGREVTSHGACFFVRDNGAGFDATSDRLFTPFSRFHSDAEFAGTGVGLATVRRIVQKHGGRIWAESQPGAGATFRFTLDAG